MCRLYQFGSEYGPTAASVFWVRNEKLKMWSSGYLKDFGNFPPGYTA
jgi:hypothetical protein